MAASEFGMKLSPLLRLADRGSVVRIWRGLWVSEHLQEMAPVEIGPYHRLCQPEHRGSKASL